MKAPLARSLGGVADAVGHCVLVFAFAPTLAALPAWLYFEAHNPLNLQEPVVLTFVPVRGAILLLDAFAAGVSEGVLAGAIHGILVSAWASWRGRVSTRRQRIGLGAIGGALAACLMIFAQVSVGVVDLGQLASHGGVVAFEIVSGMLCGLVATPTALRLLNAALGIEGAQVPAHGE